MPRAASPAARARPRGRASASDYEIVLVNDGSKDGSWAKMQQLAAGDPNLVAVNLSRNHGHQLALTAGLDLAPRRLDPDHRRRPPGPARAAGRDGRDDAPRGRRRRLRRAQEPGRRDRVQARHRARLLPAAGARDRGRHPARRRRFPADEPARARRLPGDARAGALHPRHGRLARLQAGADRLRPRRAARGRDQISAVARCSASPSTR